MLKGKKEEIREDVLVHGIHGTAGYSHAAKVGNLLFIAGQVPKDIDGNVVGEDDIET